MKDGCAKYVRIFCKVSQSVPVNEIAELLQIDKGMGASGDDQHACKARDFVDFNFCAPTQ